MYKPPFIYPVITWWSFWLLQTYCFEHSGTHFVRTYIFSSLEYLPRSVFQGFYGNPLFDIFRNCQPIFNKSIEQFYTLISNVCQFPYILSNTCYFSHVLIITMLVDVNMYLVFWIYRLCVCSQSTVAQRILCEDSDPGTAAYWASTPTLNHTPFSKCACGLGVHLSDRVLT